MGEPDEKPDVGASAADLYSQNLDLVRSVINFVSRTMRLSPQDQEDFASSVHLKLIEDDYGVLRKFRGGSTLKTYLVVVVKRFGIDYRNQKWGKWRPSVPAKRLGKAGVAMETLLARDGRPLSEAVAVGAARGLGSEEELEEIAAQLPVRFQRSFDSEDILQEQPGSGPNPLQRLRLAERARLRAEILRATREASSELGDRDGLLLRMNFEDGLSVADISRVLGLDQKKLYRRRQRIFAALRRKLEEKGFRRQDLVEVLTESNP